VEEGQEGVLSIKTLDKLSELTAARHWVGSKNEKNARANAQACLTVLGKDSNPRVVDSGLITRVPKIRKLREVDQRIKW